MTKIRWTADRNSMLDILSLQGKRCAEIGVFKGEFSQEILKRNPFELWLVDPWQEQPTDVYPEYWNHPQRYDFGQMYKDVVKLFEHAPQVKVLRRKSFEAAQKFENESLDFVYVDAIHTFESCYMDMVSWFPKVIPGGWLCGHDFTGEFVGVRQAITAFCRITGQEVSLLTTETVWASWGIQRV